MATTTTPMAPVEEYHHLRWGDQGSIIITIIIAIPLLPRTIRAILIYISTSMVVELDTIRTLEGARHRG